MAKPCSSLYSVRHPDTQLRLADTIDRACQQSSQPSLVFFRADDIGVPSHQFSRLIQCFIKHRMPLCLATVPAWTTNRRFAELRQLTGSNTGQWCWHQHGRLHRNFETEGKKQEFGPARCREDIKSSLHQGQRRLRQIIGSEFEPFFTPPWNRCSLATIESLVDLGFAALSRSCGALPETVSNLPDFQVNVDLHTRKELSPEHGLANLLAELELAVSSGQCGIMIHHQRMNDNAFEFLDLLLSIIKRKPNLRPVLFKDLLATKDRACD